MQLIHLTFAPQELVLSYHALDNDLLDPDQRSVIQHVPMWDAI